MKISILHVIYDDHIWPSFLYSSSEKFKEQLLIGSLTQDDSFNIYEFERGFSIDDTVTVVTYKSKTMLNVLTEIAGLLVLLRLATLVLGIFH
jgi:hypothetical protein